MMQSVSGYDIDHLAREAHVRWLKPAEIFFILNNHDECQLTHIVPQKPESGSLYLYNKRVLKFFRKDGHNWKRRKGQKTIAEGHERLKVENTEKLNCYYAHGEENPNFQRRSYWMLDPAYEHIVLVHYRDIEEGRQNNRATSQFSPLSTFSPMHNSFTSNQAESPFIMSESYELHQNESSPSSVEMACDEVIRNYEMNQLDFGERVNEVNSLMVPDLSQALRSIAHQLSLTDDVERECNNLPVDNGHSDDLEHALFVHDLTGQTSDGSDNFLLQQEQDDKTQQYDQFPAAEGDIWNDLLDSSSNLMLIGSRVQLVGQDVQNSSLMIPREDVSVHYPSFSPELNAYGINSNSYPSLLDEVDMGIPLHENTHVTIAQKQKFTIQEISPEWCYTSEAAKIIIVGFFLCDPSESTWACMFGDTEVPVQIIREGVIRCHAPPHLHGKVTLCITSGNRESCSEVRDFEYRPKPNVCTHSNPSETETVKSSEEQHLLARFAQMLLVSDLPYEDPWNRTINSILDGTSASSDFIDRLLQELLKNQLQVWLSTRLQQNRVECSLSKTEQGIIHIVAGLGYEWALQTIQKSGVSVNFRDKNGWTALHWAAKFGREKIVGILIASGALAGAITDPNKKDPNGKTPADIAASSGHIGLAAYLAEAALTTHLSSLTIKESEISRGNAAVEAERTISGLSIASSSINEDPLPLQNTLVAIQNATQAAARIQSAFRAHSFRKRRQKELASDSGDEYGISTSDIHSLSAASKLTFGHPRDFSTAALSIQKNFKGYKGRKEFLTFRKNVVKIQACVRGYQVRKYYKVCWAVSVLEKVVLRWRRHGVGLRGFKPEPVTIDDCEEEDILRVFRKQKVGPAIDEAVSRVLSMVESPEARQQYHRILEKYRQAKAELEN